MKGADGSYRIAFLTLSASEALSLFSAIRVISGTSCLRVGGTEGKLPLLFLFEFLHDSRKFTCPFEIVYHRELEEDPKQHSAGVPELLALELNQLKPDVFESILPESDLEIAR